MIAALLERGTKPFILFSLFGAASLTVTTASRWEGLPWVSVIALCASYLAARRFPTAVAQGWMGLTYVTPALLTLILGDFQLGDLTPWFAGLTGMMLATVEPTRWHLPAPWRTPLVAWGMVVAVAWPVVWLRELDFAPAIVGAIDTANNGLGMTHDNILLWVYSVVLSHGVGLLWIDWLFATVSRDDEERLFRTVLTPLAVSCGVATLVAAYQSVFDIGFLNPMAWATLRRVSGTLMDANPFGMLAALWGAIGIAVLLSWRRMAGAAPTRLLAAAGAILAASWFGLWVSGSRSALLAGGFLFLFIARALAPVAFRASGRRPALAGLLVVALSVGALVASGSSVGPWQRLAPTLPSASVDSFRAFGQELWNRNWYGTAAVRMFADSPMVGIGVGSFRVLVPDVAYELGHGRIAPDNAQNWFRHQLTEFGIVGSLGWIVWVLLFLRLLFRGRLREDRVAAGGLVRGALIALGLVSLVGMPTQNAALALTFWTLAFWYERLMAPDAVRSTGSRVPPVAVWAGVWVLAFGYAAGLAAASWFDLRVPYRAQRANWDYSYGFYEPELDSAGAEFRWAGRRGLAVVPLRDRWIEVSAWVHHRDMVERPVTLEVRVDGVPLINAVRQDASPLTEAVRIPEDRTRVLVEAEVDRTWCPCDWDQPDARQLGPGVSWRFIDP